MDKIRQLAHDLIDTLKDEEVRLLVAYAHQIQEGHFAALTNGLTREEIGEVLLQSAVYCGVPAANSAFATAQRVFDEMDGTDGPSNPSPST